MKIRVVIIDDFNVHSEGLQLIIDSESDMQVIGILNDASSYLQQFEISHPEVILLNTKLIDSKISKFAHHFRSAHTDIKLIYLVETVDEHLLYHWVNHHPDGVLQQDLSPELFTDSIRAIYKDLCLHSTGIAYELKSKLHHADVLRKLLLHEQLKNKQVEISMKELDILYLMAQQKDNKEISEELGLEDKSVREYIRNLYRTLQLKNRSETIRYLRKVMNE